MVYISNWQEYQDAAEALYAASPNKTRYVVKWKVTKQSDPATRGQLVLKITDDVTCLKYKTSSSIVLNRFEALNLELAKRMRNAKAVKVEEEETAMDVDVERTGTPIQVSGVAGGGAAKKKKGKKKK